MDQGASRRGSSPDSQIARELERLRGEIDRVDRSLLEGLNARARLVQEIGRLKRRAGEAVYRAERERDLIARLIEDNPGPFPDRAIPAVFREVIAATRSLEGPLRVGYLGPAGTFGHQAARKQFGASCELVALGSIAEVFEAVERGRCELGVVPVENTTEGVVTETLDRFVEARVTICGEVLLPISHDLLGCAEGLDRVRRVASHPQALAQCRGWLERHLPGVERVEFASTAAAAQAARSDPELAAVASSIAAETYGLRVLARAIEDRADNTTRFLVLGREPPPPSGADLTSAVFTVRRDRPGTLLRLLEPFARNGVNLTSIQARPIRGKPWEYLFFLDMEGHASDPPVAKALGEAAERAESHRLLGSFPAALDRARAGAGS